MKVSGTGETILDIDMNLLECTHDGALNLILKIVSFYQVSTMLIVLSILHTLKDLIL